MGNPMYGGLHHGADRPQPPAVWHQASARPWLGPRPAVAAATFEVVNCCGALHLFPDVSRVLGEVHRVLAGGGHFTMAVVRAGDRPRDRRAAQLRRRFLGAHSFAPADLDRQLGQAGFHNFQALHEHGLRTIAAAIKRS